MVSLPLLQLGEVCRQLAIQVQRVIGCSTGHWEAWVKTYPLTVKVHEELLADLEAFAVQEFPQDCPKCQGDTVLSDGSTCPKCEGQAVVGNRSEAARFLLHFGLGEKVSPEMRAMLAAYAEIRSKLISVISNTAHRMEKGFHADVMEAIKGIRPHVR